MALTPEDRIAALETLAKDLQRRVRDLEAASDVGPPQSHTERNRRIEEAPRSGTAAVGAGDTMPPRRDVLGAPHSER